jgi:hypothetical protein
MCVPGVNAGRNFASGTNQSLSITSGAPIPSLPFSISAWFWPESNADFQAIVGIGVNNSNDNRYLINIEDSATGQHATAQTRTNSTVQAISPNTYNVGQWNHVLAVWTSTSSRTVYLNGGTAGTNSTTRAPTGMNAIYIGNNMNISTAIGVNIAEVAIYDVALTATDAAQLSKRLGPPMVKVASILNYWPIYGRGSTEPDLFGGANLTVNSATASPHPGVFK